MDYCRNYSNLLKFCLLSTSLFVSSCTAPQEKDHRTDTYEGYQKQKGLQTDMTTGVVPVTESRNVKNVPHGLSPVTESRDSENLFFCPASGENAQWGVLSSNRHSRNFKLYIKNLENLAQGFVTIPGAGTGNNLFPVLNSDNSRLAFCSDRDGTWRVYVLDINTGSHPAPITPEGEECLCPAWDPQAENGGERVAFSRYNSREEKWEAWIAEPGSLKLAFVGEGLFPDWSPDGRYLAVQRRRMRGAGQFSLWLLSVENTEPPRALFMSEQWAAANPCWSPDGRYIAFNTVGRGAGEDLFSEGGGIYYINLETNRTRNVIKQHCWRPAWSPSGKIFFHKREGKAVNIHAVEGPLLSSQPDLTHTGP